MPIRILLADDHQIMRQGLSALLQGQPDMEVVAEAGEGRTALNLARELAPDVIVMDVAMPNLNGIETARMVGNELPNIKVIALSMHSDRRFVKEMLKAGAQGYLLKDCDPEELIRAIRSVIANQAYLSPQVAGSVIDGFVRQSVDAQGSAYSVLSSREREVLQLLAEGMSTKAISGRLNVSSKTIETHRRNIMDKLGIQNMAELIKYALREGLTDL